MGNGPELICSKEASEILGVKVTNLLNKSYAGTKIPVIKRPTPDENGRTNFYVLEDVLTLAEERDQRAEEIMERKRMRKESSLRRQGLLEDDEVLDIEGNTRLVSGFVIQQVGHRAKITLDGNLVANCATPEEARDYLILQRGKPAPRPLF
jgi:hypothetical protein